MESEFKVKIFDIMKTSTPSGRTCDDGSPAGDTVRQIILDSWDNYEKISIYFDGIAKMTRPFVDEAFGKVLESKNLEQFNSKLHFPDATDTIVKDLNQALKLRMKIIQAAKDRADAAAGD